MTITKEKAVWINMMVKDPEGNVVDQTVQGRPLAYLHGAGNLIPALEEALEGKGKGDSVTVNLTPENGYGERNEELKRKVPAEQLQGVEKIEVGMQFQADTGAGIAIFTVIGVEGDEITVDGNHPYAGRTLEFELSVDEVRDATAEELTQGFVRDEVEG